MILVQVNTTLTHLDIGQNQLGFIGGTAFGSAIMVNQTLSSLYLGHNQFGSAGGAAFAEALKVH